MSYIQFVNIDLSTGATPSEGVTQLGYDVDGVLKQRDSTGITTITYNLPIGKNPPDQIFEDWHNYQDIKAINDAKVGQRYKYVDTHGDNPMFIILEVTSVRNGVIIETIATDVTIINFDS